MEIFFRKNGNPRHHLLLKMKIYFYKNLNLAYTLFNSTLYIAEEWDGVPNFCARIEPEMGAAVDNMYCFERFPSMKENIKNERNICTTASILYTYILCNGLSLFLLSKKRKIAAYFSKCTNFDRKICKIFSFTINQDKYGGDLRTTFKC